MRHARTLLEKRMEDDHTQRHCYFTGSDLLARCNIELQRLHQGNSNREQLPCAQLIMRTNVQACKDVMHSCVEWIVD
jgi:hypothetical protein